ncbi:MAG TPA: L,D-transpeptidase family protein [Streptosporangiaceae bacterium]|nr:L,D-transpeptidase family protein [Streptosporangiaceae bacterium]
MRRTVRGWLGALGAVTALGGWVLSQAGVAGAAAAWPATRSAPASAAGYVPPKGTLSPGMHGPAIRSLQRRLAQLHYYPGPVDGQFGNDTLEAVWAFKEVQGIQTAVNPDDVGRVMKQALVNPRQPKALKPKGGSWRVEVHLTLGYLVLYRHNVPELISHISPGGGYYYPCPGPVGGTCGPAITPDGNFRAHWFAPGWVKVPLGEMYNPVFFIGGAYAIHGDIPVPLAPVSHGCVRIPMDIAAFFHRMVHISETNGTPIYIRGRAPGT